MIIEVTLDGRGAVRIETEYAANPKQIKRLVEHATDTVVNAEVRSKPRPIGFGAGSSLDTEVDPADSWANARLIGPR